MGKQWRGYGHTCVDMQEEIRPAHHIDTLTSAFLFYGIGRAAKLCILAYE